MGWWLESCLLRCIAEVLTQGEGFSQAQGKKLRARYGLDAVWCRVEYSYGRRRTR